MVGVVKARWLLMLAMLTGCAAHAISPAPPRISGAVLLVASQPWQQGAIGEPSVWTDHGSWRMIFSAGWDQMAVGYATAPTVDGPWTQDAEPVLGLGHGGWAGSAREPSLLVDHDQLYVYFSPTTEPGSPHACDLMVATGKDARHLHTLTTAALRPVGAAKAIVNVSVVRDGATYRMIFESRIADSAMWAMGYALGNRPSSFKPVAFPLPSLQRGNGAYGGPDLHRTPRGWTVLYHAAQVGTLPTDIYQATSTDLTHWTRGPLVVAHPAGSDQAADPYLAGGHLFYSVVNNPDETSTIN